MSMDKIKDNYPNGCCPDCYAEIPDNAVSGEECIICGHVFWNEQEND